MSTSGDKETVAIIAGADLRTAQYKVIAVAGTIAAANDAALGVLQNKPNIGESASIAYAGHLKGTAAAAIAVGARLKVTAGGYLTTVASGDGTCGKALTAASSGALVEFVGDFSRAATTY